MIELHNVSKTVMSGSEPLTILHPLTTTIPAGQFVAIVGPSGSGKSTLLGLIAGLDAPSSGSVTIDGTDITRLDEDRLARLRGEKIGFVFQFFHLIPSLTALENVAVPMEIAGTPNAMARARARLDEVGLTGRAHHYPSQLSGGEQQRVALARALANDPPILLADEPTGNLDSANGRHIMDLMRNIHSVRRSTLVLVTHDAELAAMADARLVLRDGRVVEHAGVEVIVAMSFVLRMAVRETRSSWRRLLFFFVCIAVGVAAIVAMRSVIQSVREVFGREARTLIAADVLISTTREWTPEARATIDRRLAEAGATGRAETIETPTMVRPADRSKTAARMCELRAIGPEFPLYGTLTLATGCHLLAWHAARPRRPGAARALDRSRCRGGRRDRHRSDRLHDPGVIETEPGRRVGDFSLGPRILIDAADLASTGLLTLGSRARRVMLVRLPEARIESLVRTLRDDFKDEFVNARSFRATDDEVGRDFERAENYLSLVGLVIVILGGIAVSSVTRVFILQKIRSIAVLKCVGARSDQIIAVYLIQVLTLGLAGSLLGILLARGAIAALPFALQSSAPASSATLLADVQYGVTWSAALQGLGIGALVSLLFSIVPLLQVRFVKPSLLLRDETTAQAFDWTRAIAVVLVSVCPRGTDGMAGGVVADRSLRLCRVLRAGRRARAHGQAPRSGRCAAGSGPILSACATPCSICRARETRPVSSCSRSASAPSSSSACGRSRAVCSRSSRCRCRKMRPTCS